MTEKKTQEVLFKFFNKNKIKYSILRGYDKASAKQEKDLDILILKGDYEKFKDKFPKTDRILHFYIDKEKHFGIVFISKKALYRNVFDKEKNFYKLGYKDYKRMLFFRKILKLGRKIKEFFGMY